MLASNGVLSAQLMMMEMAADVLAAEDESTHGGCEIALACRDIGSGARRRELHLRVAMTMPVGDVRLASSRVMGCFEILWKE